MRDPWEDPDTAAAYAEFTRQHPMYRDSSGDLVALAAPGGADTVLDLCCGTGETSRAILVGLGPDGRVIGVDGSAAMLSHAACAVTDPRVRWVRSRAEEVDRSIQEPVAATVCNSAIWQTELSETLRAVRRILLPGKRFVFNIGQAFLADGGWPAPRRDLVHGMTELARRELGWRPRRTAAPRGWPSVDRVRQLLHAAGYDPVEVHPLRYEATMAEVHAWLSVPIFTERVFPDLAYPVRKSLLDRAYQDVDPTEVDHADWVAFVAVAAGEGGASEGGAVQ